MRASFHARLLNPPFEDPGLYVIPRFGRRGFLFDLGDLSNVSPRELIALTDVFVSHTHMDHFCGFDRLLRVLLRRPTHIRIYGPPGLIESVEHKIQAYTWNLLSEGETGCSFEVLELHEESTWSATFSVSNRLQHTPIKHLARATDVILREPGLRVRFARLDHGIASLAYKIEEPVRVGFRKERLATMGIAVGPWLDELKVKVLQNAPPETEVTPTWLDPNRRGKTVTLADLAHTTLKRPGLSLAYVTDIAYTDDNVERLKVLASGVNTLYIEASFRASEHKRAGRRAHLTTAQAGLIARFLGADRVEPFHFSPKHLGEEKEMRAEVEAAWREDPIDNSGPHSR